jgi:hypothetical protein
MQWLHDPNQGNVYNMNNVRREASRHFKNKRENIWKLKLIKLQQKAITRIISETFTGALISLRWVTNL